MTDLKPGLCLKCGEFFTKEDKCPNGHPREYPHDNTSGLEEAQLPPQPIINNNYQTKEADEYDPHASGNIW